jgi:hypothetical protein
MQLAAGAALTWMEKLAAGRVGNAATGGCTNRSRSKEDMPAEPPGVDHSR